MPSPDGGSSVPGFLAGVWDEYERNSVESEGVRMKSLAGIRVVDFSWVRAGPWATRWLGAFGAEIIKIEWPENERGRLPSTTTPRHLAVNLNTSGNFNDTNVNKKSISLSFFGRAPRD